MQPVAFLFAHGAGQGSTSPWMQGWAARLATLGPVRTFDYPYMAAGRRAPDRLPRLVEAHGAELADFRATLPEGTRVVLVGKSMGSRVGCHLALQAPVSGLVCLGYPLVGIGKRRPVRSQVLQELATPVLFVQGSRDKLCPLDLLAQVRAGMAAPTWLHVVPTGDHSLLVTRGHQRATGTTQADADQASFDAISAFVAGLP